MMWKTLSESYCTNMYVADALVGVEVKLAQEE